MGLIHKDWPVLIPEGGRTSYLRRRAWRSWWPTDRVDQPAEAAELPSRSTYKPLLKPFTDPAAAVASGCEDAVWGLDGNVLSVSSNVHAGGDCRGGVWPRSSAHKVHETFHHPAGGARLPGTRVDAGGAQGRRTASGVIDVYSGVVRECGTTGTRWLRCSGSTTSSITVELVSNGGAFGGKEDMLQPGTDRPGGPPAGTVRSSAPCRGRSPSCIHSKRHPDPHRAVPPACDALRTGSPPCKARMLGDSGPYASVGMKVLERAAGHASGPYVVPNIDVKAVAARTNNSGVRRLPGLRGQPGPVRHGRASIDRLADAGRVSAGWEMRSRNAVIDPWSGVGSGTGDGRRLPGRSRVPQRRQTCITTRRGSQPARPSGLGLGLKNSGLGNGFKESQPGPWCTSCPTSATPPALRPDPTLSSRSGTAGRRWDRASTRWPSRWRPRSWACDPDLDQGLSSIPAGNSGAGQTTGSRGTLMGAGAIQSPTRAGQPHWQEGCLPDVDYHGDYRDRLDQLPQRRSRANPTIHSAFGYAAQLVIADQSDRARSSGWWPHTTSVEP